MTILITGANGFVGNVLKKYMKGAIAAPSIREYSMKEIERLLEPFSYGTVIHTAAISDIATCERKPDESLYANVVLPMMMANVCEKNRIKFIAFSSDQVYSGMEEEGPYEEDRAKTGNLYAKHKLMMEQTVLEENPSAVCLRAEWMFDFISPKGNFYLNLLRAKDDVLASRNQFRGVTYVKEVAEEMEGVMQLPGGVYNFGSETQKSVYELTSDFLRLIHSPVQVKEGPARHNLWMDCSKARALGVNFSEAFQGLKHCYEDSLMHH